MKLKVLSILLLTAMLAGAQNISCQLSGTLHDPTGALIVGAKITLTAERTGFVRTTHTNTEGFFSFPDLTPAAFDVNIAAPGFKTYSQRGIEITSGGQLSLGVVTMQLGETAESIVVTAEAANMLVASPERAGVLTGSDLEGLATRGRDIMDAVGLLPGVVDLNDARESPGKDSLANVFILGGRANQKNMTIDGVSAVTFGDATAINTMPSMDSVGELKVLMSNYAAEYGRNTGGTITVITKGGGRQFHATANWYHRHEQFSANNYFNNLNGLNRSPYRFNIFTYALSGPVFIPGKFNKDRSKLFFYFSQEYQRQLTNASSRKVTVPTAIERAGDFSQSFDVNGRLRTIYDPQANQTAFPGNKIPTSRFSRTGQKVLELFPLPNFVDPNPSLRYQWNYISAASYPNPRRGDIVRVDYSPKSNVQLYGRYSQNRDEQRAYYGPWTSGSVNFPLVPVVYEFPGRSITISSTATLSPSMFNQFTFGMTESTNSFYPEDVQKVSRKGTGIDIASWYPANNPAGIIPNMSFGGVNAAANPSLNNRITSYMDNAKFNPSYIFSENLSKVYGTHTLKFGAYVEKAFGYPFADNQVRGSVSFGVDRTNPLDSNYAYSNALTGIYQSYQESTSQPLSKLRFRNIEWYAQDDWRVRSGLFVNYGLRIYNAPPMWDALQQQLTFLPDLFNSSKAPVLLRPALDSSKAKIAVDPRTGAVYPAVRVGTFAPGFGEPDNGMAVVGTKGLPQSLYTTPALSMGPRLGFAWDPIGSGRTVIRGGGGVFFNRPAMGPMNSMPANPPTVYTPIMYFGTLETLGQAGGQGILAPTSSITAMSGSQQQQTTYNFSFGVQQQIARKLVVDVSYVGSLARHMWATRNINAVPVGAQFLDLHPENRDLSTTASALPANFLRPYQGWGDILFYDFGASSNYNSLQVSATRRLARGVLAMSYTFSKLLGTASSDSEQMSSVFATRDRNYGVLSYDRPQVLSLRYNYKLPEPGKYFQKRLLGLITDRWEVSGITRFMSGAPFTPTFSTVDGANITGTPSETARPNVVDPTADAVNRFGRPARGTFGNVGKNVLRGPGMNNWDVSIFRQIPLRESKYIQLRFESYNTLNHTQFSAVSQNARFDAQGNQIDPLFLQATAARAPRRVQVAIRLIW